VFRGYGIGSMPRVNNNSLKMFDVRFGAKNVADSIVLPGPLPQSSIAWFFDEGVIWSERADQPAKLGSPTTIGNFRDTD
jgi:hypothetical protein